MDRRVYESIGIPPKLLPQRPDHVSADACREIALPDKAE